MSTAQRYIIMDFCARIFRINVAADEKKWHIASGILSLCRGSIWQLTPYRGREPLAVMIHPYRGCRNLIFLWLSAIVPPRRWKRLLSITGGAQYPRIGTKRGTSTLKGSPITLFGHSFRVLASIELVIRGCSLRSYPRLLSEDRVAVSLVVWLRIII